MVIPIQRLSPSIPCGSLTSWTCREKKSRSYAMDMRRFLRIGRLLGDESVHMLSECHVTVVGMGAVGSYALEVLARSGVRHIRVVDFDTVGITNINRQLLATESTLGRKKVEVARQRVLDINPEAHVESFDIFAHEESLDTILVEPVDLVLDAIDSRSEEHTS